MALIRPSLFMRQISPRGAVADFRSVYEQAGSNRWRFALAAAAMTFGIFYVMWQEEVRGLPRPLQITYINSWPVDRTDAEITASNLANQRRKDAVAAEMARREDARREMYKALGRVSGMDVDAIEKKALADRAAEAARKKAETEALTRKAVPGTQATPKANAEQ